MKPRSKKFIAAFIAVDIVVLILLGLLMPIKQEAVKYPYEKTLETACPQVVSQRGAYQAILRRDLILGETNELLIDKLDPCEPPADIIIKTYVL